MIFAIHAVVWYLDFRMISSPYIRFLLPLLLLAVGILTQINTKKALAGFISTKQAMSVFLICIGIALVITYLGDYLLFQVLRPDYNTTLFEEGMELAANYAKEMGATDQEILDHAKNQLTAGPPYNFRNTVAGFGISFALNIIVGFISSLVLKNERPSA